MSNTGKYKHTCREWRVNIDGKIVVGRWKNALGAINGAADKLFGNAGMGEERPDFTDLAIHVECIGEPLPDPAAERRLSPKPGPQPVMRTAIADLVPTIRCCCYRCAGDGGHHGACLLNTNTGGVDAY